MRPLKIELQYFGPYEHEIIDFTQFRTQSLFLVAGNTGAGKTTIFDAMCYALFGQTTNDRDRSATALRSDFAPADSETFVKFTFTHQGMTYQVTRRPKQVLQGKKGNLITHNQAVELIYPLESQQPTEITKIKEADTFITDLLNLTRDQFKQIVLLPQGKFRQFLDSDSNTKEALLRDLFNTSRYEQWTQALKDKLRTQKKELEGQQTKLQSLKETITVVDSQLTITEWLVAVKEYHAKLQSKLADLNKLEQTQQKTVASIEKKLHVEQELVKNLVALKEAEKLGHDLADQKEKMTTIKQQIADLEWYQEHQTNYQRWHDNEQRLTGLTDDANHFQGKLTKATSEYEQVERQFSELDAKQASMDQLQDQVNNLNRILPLFTECDDLKQIITKGQKSVDELTDQQAKRKQQLASLKEQLTSILHNLTANQDLSARQVALAKDQGQHKELVNDGQRLATLLAEQTQKNEANKTLTHQLAEQVQKAKEDTDHLADLNDAYARHQIAILAKKLKPQTPCPVCGSLGHPHPATLDSQQLITDEQIEQATKQAQKSQSDLARLQEKAAQAKQTLAELQTQIKNVQEKVATLLGEKQLPEDWTEQIEQRGQRLNERQQQLAKLATKIQQWQQQQVSVQDQIQANQEQIDQDEKELRQLSEELAVNRARLAEKQATLPADFTTEQEVLSKIKQGQEQITAFTQQLKATQEQRQTSQQRVTTVQAQLKQTSQEIFTLKQTQTKYHQQLLEALAQYNPALKWEFWQNQAEQLTRLGDLRKELQDYNNQVRDNNAQQQQLKEAIAERPMPDIIKTENELTAARQVASQQQQKIGQLNAQTESLKKTQEKVNRLTAKTGNLDQQINELQTLTDVVSGNTESHVSLERYVLQAYFQDVLVAANVQLDRLTNGRYQFELATESQGAGAKWSGLEVNVYDDNAGRTRSARTLSGGESFMASLALALALCQIIQEQSGGISIDALFVDEGFGSLDQEALGDALHALQELEGHRMIGIISHVTELEEQIPDQLLVKSVNGRSKVSYQHEI